MVSAKGWAQLQRVAAGLQGPVAAGLQGDRVGAGLQGVGAGLQLRGWCRFTRGWCRFTRGWCRFTTEGLVQVYKGLVQVYKGRHLGLPLPAITFIREDSLPRHPPKDILVSNMVCVSLELQEVLSFQILKE